MSSSPYRASLIMPPSFRLTALNFHRVLLTGVASFLIFLLACNDPSSEVEQPPLDMSLIEQEFSDYGHMATSMGREDASAQADVSHQGDVVDMGTDMAPEAVDASARPVPMAPELALPLATAEIMGSHSMLSDGGVLLDRESVIRWRLDPVSTGQWRWAIRLKAKVWRYEDGRVSIGSNGTFVAGHLHGDGRAGSSWIRMPYEAWDGDEFQTSLPPTLSWDADDLGGILSIRADVGGLMVYGATLADRRSMPNPQAPATDTPGMPTAFRACSDPGCDDGARLSELIATADDDPINIRLVSETYTANTPVVVRRSNVRITGSREGENPVWRWQPLVGSGQRSSFEFRGPGEGAMAPMPLADGVRFGQRRFVVESPLPDDVKWVRLTADDFGDVPPVCVEGRDVERFNRHQRQLFEVLSSESDDGRTELVLDRPVNLEIPGLANPVLTPAVLLTGIELRRITLLAECPEALEVELRAPVCTNPEVVDDGGVLSLYTDGAQIDEVSAQGFGKFTIEIRDSLRNRVSNCHMDHPAAYGSGGQGYGVHLIGASRSIVDNQSVNTARHGVVVDFGSSDSQILHGLFSNMNQALIDVHGEASRDTLIRGNVLGQSNLGVIVGGGGREVHCNDGPRHHILDNTIRGCSIAGVSVSDYTPSTFVRSNILSDNSTHVLGTFGAHDIQVERNRLSGAGITPITLALQDSRDLRVRRNTFVDVCDQTDAFLALGEAELPVFEGNWFCPDDR